MERLGFVTLGKRVGPEYAMGLVGRFWTPGGDVQRMADQEAFDRFATFASPRPREALKGLKRTAEA